MKRTALALRLIKLRKGLGLSQAQFAKQIGISQSGLAYYEAGKAKKASKRFKRKLKKLNILLLKENKETDKQAKKVGLRSKRTLRFYLKHSNPVPYEAHYITSMGLYGSGLVFGAGVVVGAILTGMVFEILNTLFG